MYGSIYLCIKYNRIFKVDLILFFGVFLINYMEKDS